MRFSLDAAQQTEAPEPLPLVRTVIIGAGPAGLTAAYELSSHGLSSVVLEAGNMVGGLARTEEYKGYSFDIGGHRFFTKLSLVENLWREILPDDFITRPRLSRILYNSRFFRYPLDPVDALLGLGIRESVRCGFSYFAAQLSWNKPEENFEHWVTNRFGRRLFGIFFKSYTEKVWGMPCSQIGAEWAAQRIRGLSPRSMLWDAIRPKPRDKQKVVKTLVREFQYPRRGPGMLWNRTREIVESRGSRVVLNAPVDRIRWEPGRVLSVRAGGQEYAGDHFISTMPIRDLIQALDPEPPPYLLKAADDFKYRDFLTTCLICEGTNLFPDNWIYIHDPRVKVARIQNYGNWSPEMLPEPGKSCLGMEYFCREGNALWRSSDADLIALGRQEVSQLGLVPAGAVLGGTVLRVPKAYPVYGERYRHGLSAIRRFLSAVPNLQLVGRNGMHRYNNQDHSMLTAVLAARNIMGGSHDLWTVNADAEYHEEGAAVTETELQRRHCAT